MAGCFIVAGLMNDVQFFTGEVDEKGWRGPAALQGSPWAFAGLALLSIGLIAGCWDAGFTARDDDRYVVRNPIVTGKNPVWTAFSDASLELYIPTVVVSYRIDYALFYGLKATGLGTWAPGCRAMSLLYHVLAGFILWRWVLPRLGVRRLAAAFVTGVFLIHPAQCESVCWIAERKTVLGGLFGAAAMALYFRMAEASGARLAGMFAATVAAFALALMSKITALGILPVLFCWEVLLADSEEGHEQRRAGAGRPRPIAPVVARLAALTLVALPLLFVNWESAKDQFGIRIGANVFESLLTDVEILARYLQVLAWPPLSSPYYGLLPIATPFGGRFLIAGLGFFGPLLLTVWLPTTSAGRRRALFGWLWFAGAMSLTLNLAPQPEFMHDRYMYFSIPGAAQAVAEAVQGLVERMKWGLSPRMAASAVALLSVLLALCALQTGIDWGSEILTFERSVRKQPESSFSHGYLGLTLGVAANVAEKNENPANAKLWREKAVVHLSTALTRPDINYNLRRAQFWVAHALMLQKLNRLDEAREVLRAFLKHAQAQQWRTPGDRLYIQKGSDTLKSLGEP